MEQNSAHIVTLGDLTASSCAAMNGLRNKTAVTAGSHRATFGDILTDAEILGRELDRCGAGRADVILVMLPNGVTFLSSVLALWLQSSIPALVSVKISQQELRTIVDTLHPAGILTTPLFFSVISKVVGPAFTANQVVMSSDQQITYIALSRERSAPEVDNESALIKFTSGSTGVPKGIPLSAVNIAAELATVVKSLGISSDDRILTPVPMSHSYGFDLGALPALFGRGSLVLMESFIPRVVLRTLSATPPAVFLGVPSMYHTMADLKDSMSFDCSRVRWMLSCTAHLPPHVIHRFRERCHATICQHYGSSETGAVSLHTPELVMQLPDSVGSAMHGVSATAVGPDGKTVGPGKTGEIVVASNAVAARYLMGGPAGEERFRAGRYHTGDLGTIDERGYITLRGRFDDLINVGGYKVFPQEVVDVLQSSPHVQEAAVTGVKDRFGEEIVVAAVTLRNPVAEESLLAFCRERLADYKVPRRIDIIREFQRGPSGKIIFKNTPFSS